MFDVYVIPTGSVNMRGGDVQVGHNARGSHGMGMSSHMKMTSLRQLQPGDQARAQQIVEVARKVCEK